MRVLTHEEVRRGLYTKVANVCATCTGRIRTARRFCLNFSLGTGIDPEAAEQELRLMGWKGGRKREE